MTERCSLAAKTTIGICGNSVTKALETIRLARESERLLDARDDFEIEVILGVDKLVLSGDVEEIQDSD